MSKFQIYLFTFIILFACCFVSNAENEEQHGTMVDDLKFNDYVYTVPQMDNIITNLPGGLSSVPIGLTKPGTMDEHDDQTVDRVIFDSSTGFRFQTNANNETIISLGSSWTTLYDDLGNAFGPSGEEPLRITTHTNDTFIKWCGYTNVITTNDDVITTNNMRLLSIGVGSGSSGGPGGGANLNYYGDWVAFEYPSNSLVRYESNVWFNAEQIIPEKKFIPPGPENSDWKVFLSDGKKGDKGDPGADLHPRGLYSDSTEYNQYDLIRYEEAGYYGQYYVWTDNDNPITGISPTNTDYWRLFVKDAEGVSINSTLIRMNSTDYPGTLNLDTNTLVITNSQEGKFLTVVGGPGGGGTGALTNDIIVSSPVGQYVSGNTIGAGTPYDTIFKKMLTVKIPVRAPTLSISLRNVTYDSYKIEYGYQMQSSASINVNYVKNNAGATTNFIYKIGSYSHEYPYIFVPDNSIYTEFNSISTNYYSDIRISAQVFYQQGDPVDPDYPDDYVPAGNKFAYIDLIPTRYVYYAPLANYIDTATFTASTVRSLPSYSGGGKFLSNKTGNTQFTITCPIGTVQATVALPLEIIPNGLISAIFRSQQGSMIIETDVTSELEVKEYVDNVLPETGNPGNVDDPSVTMANKYRVYTYRSQTPFDNVVSIILKY